MYIVGRCQMSCVQKTQCIHEYIYIYTHVYIRIYIYIYTYIYTYIYAVYVCICICTYIYIYMYTHICIPMHMYKGVNIHIYDYICIHYVCMYKTVQYLCNVVGSFEHGKDTRQRARALVGTRAQSQEPHGHTAQYMRLGCELLQKWSFP